MSSDVSSLVIRIESLEAALAEQRLTKLEKQGYKTQRATSSLTASFVKLMAPIAAVVTVSAGLSKLVSTAREFEVLNAQLKSATGSAEDAANAFDYIQQFAAETPYDLQQATNAFTQLVNYGLTPSEEAMTSYGNTASALGKDLSQMVEAVADAATGEFERLKEFGIKSKNQGDTVAFTFQGVTTTVKNNAEEIEGYLIGLGNNNFAGAMADRMDTLDGAISNLGDEWDKLFLNISNQGAGDMIASSVRTATDALEELNSMLASGQMGAYLDAIGARFKPFSDIAVSAFDAITSTVEDVPAEWWAAVDQAIDFISDGVLNLPAYMVAAVKQMAVELGSLVDYGEIYSEALADSVVNAFDQMVDEAQAYSAKIGSVLNPFGDEFNLDAELAEIEATYAKASESIWETVEQRTTLISDARRDSINEIHAERDAYKESVTSQIAEAERLREEYDKTQAAKRAASEDQDNLAQYKIKGDSSGQSSSTTSDTSEEFQSLLESLQSEEDAIRASYERRLQIILDNTEAGSLQQQELVTRITDETNEKLLEATGSYWEKYLATAEDALWDFESLATSTVDTFTTSMGDAFADMMYEGESFGDAMSSVAESMGKNFISALGQMAAEWLAYQAVQLLTSKTAATSSAATIAAQAQAQVALASLNAYAATAAIPLTGPALAPAAAATATAATEPLAAAATAAAYAGIAHGGLTNVPEESTYLLQKGERVLSPNQNADFTSFMNNGAGSTGASNISINITNNAASDGYEATASTTTGENGELINIIIEKAKTSIAKDIKTGGTTVSSALEKTYSVSRG